MKLPRWLSPVRTVEAETGWPRPLCQKVAHAGSSAFDRRELLEKLVILPLGIILAAVVTYVFRSVEPPLLTRKHVILDVAWDALFVVLLFGPVGVPLFALFFAIMTRKTRRYTRRYMQGPWCLECRYPAPAAQATADLVCPECGEPIPPEIAALAAKRANAKG